MNAAAAGTYRPHEDDNPMAGMTTPFMVSVGLHVLVLVLGIVSLPFLTPPPIVVPTAVTVEMVDITEIAQTDNMAPVNNPKEISEDKPETTPEPVYNREETPTPLETPREPEIEDVPPPPVDKPEPPKPEPEQLTIPEDAKPAPTPKVKPKPPKPKPQPKAEDKPKAPPKETASRDINSLLKDITPDEKKDKSFDQLLNESTSQGSRPSQIAAAGSQITASEIDALNRGVSPCWFVDAGAAGAKSVVVSLKVYVGSDLVVTRVEILDMNRYNSDPVYKSFADSARRALTNPQCSKLHLPPEKYEAWKVFKYNFDPSGMI